MKLNEIKTLPTSEVDLQEGVIPVHISMTLEQIISSGKITNNVQSFVMAGLVDMFKGGGPYRWPRELNMYNMSTMGTGTDMIEAVRGLGPDEQTQVAQWLLIELNNIAGYESRPRWSEELDPSAWMRAIIQKQ